MGKDTEPLPSPVVIDVSDSPAQEEVIDLTSPLPIVLPFPPPRLNDHRLQELQRRLNFE
jgi:hypothetical protein